MPVKITSWWENRVVFPQDTVSGQPMPSLVGCVYLLAEDDGNPLACDGTLYVELCDVSRLAPGESPTPLERWTLDKASLKKLLRKDIVGQRYTVPLPWGSYRPDITKVQLQLTFVPDKGTPIHASPAQVTLNSDAPPALQQRREVPGAPRPLPSGLTTTTPPLQPSAGPSGPTVTRIPIAGNRQQ
jgi:hypothetical protein